MKIEKSAKIILWSTLIITFSALVCIMTGVAAIMISLEVAIISLAILVSTICLIHIYYERQKWAEQEQKLKQELTEKIADYYPNLPQKTLIKRYIENHKTFY